MRYSGKIGYAVPTETAPGVWVDVITEHPKIGDVVQRTEVLDGSDSVIPQYRTTTSISVLSDGVLKENYRHLRYVSYMGENWMIGSAVMQDRRLVIYIGEVYDGPTPV